MKKIKNNYIKLIILIFTISLTFTCSDVDTKTANVKINLGLNSAYSGQISRAQAPSNITDIELTITGSGMRTLTSEIPTETGVLSINVPIGSDRLFSVSASISSSNFTYGGSSTIDVIAEGPNTVDITMAMQQATLNVTIPNQSNYTGTVQYFIVSVAIEETSGTEQMMFIPSETITMPVPPGDNRGISIIAVPGSNSAVASFSTETATADFIDGEEFLVGYSPVIEETKLIIPDYNNYRVVKITDMSGAGWTVADYTNVGLSAMLDFRPYDIELDKYGRIYIANNYGNTGGVRNTVIRINDITGTNQVDYGTIAANSGIESIAIDETNELIYYTYASGGTQFLYQANLDGSGATSLAVNVGATIQNIYGLDIDDSGSILYMAGRNSLGQPRTFRYNIATETTTHTYSTNLIDPRGVLYKNNSIFVANRTSVNGFKILKLDAATISTLEGNYGNEASSSDRNQGQFYDPWRFVALKNEKITIIDDTDSPNNFEKLIAMDDINGTNWDTFVPQEDIAQSKFDFFIEC